MKKSSCRSFLIVCTLLALFQFSCVKEILRVPVVPNKKVTKVEFLRASDQNLSSLQDLESFLIPNTPIEDTITIGYIRITDFDSSSQLINVKLKIDSSAVQPGFVPLTTTDYFLTPGVSTVPSQLVVPVKIALKKGNLNYTDIYGLAITIDSALDQNLTVASDANGLNFSLSIINEWDGVYSLTGYSFKSDEPGKTGPCSLPELELATTDDSTITFRSFQPWADGEDINGIGTPILTINKTTNKVTISSSGNIYNTPGYDSRFDPGSGTFYISFTWGSGPSQRLATDTLTYLRNR